MEGLGKFLIIIALIGAVIFFIYYMLIGRFFAPINQFGPYYKLYFMGSTHCREYMGDLVVADVTNELSTTPIATTLEELQNLGLAYPSFTLCLFEEDEGKLDATSDQINDGIQDKAGEAIDNKLNNLQPDEDLIFSPQLPWPDYPQPDEN